MWTDGFLGYRTSFMLDFVVCALLVIVPVLTYSICLVRFRRHYNLHRKVQTVLCIVLFIAVGAFEVDLQIVHGGWENVVAKSFDDTKLLTSKIYSARPWLWLHLVFAVSTPLLWIATLVLALRRFPSPPAPAAHSRIHRRLGWFSALDVSLTAVTGLIFYYVAFVQA